MKTRKFSSLLGCCALLLAPTSVTAWQYTTIYGGPEYSSTLGTGFQFPNLPVNPGATVNNYGVAVGFASKYDGGTSRGSRAVRWDSSGTAATELGNLGTNSSGWTNARAYAINAANTAVGYAQMYDGGSDLGFRAVRWDATGTFATELDNLGTDPSGLTYTSASAINGAGTAVGIARKYDAGVDQGTRAVRWDAAGTIATELGHLGTDPLGSTGASAYAINGAGTAVGIARKYDAGVDQGRRAVRWDAAGTFATELGNLGTDSSGYTDAFATAINAAGIAVGYADKYDGGVLQGWLAVRWNAGETTATELGRLGTDSSVYEAGAHAINAAGTAVGYSFKYDGNVDLGQRAVRWDAGGTVATELGSLGTDSLGRTAAHATAINDAGIAVGQSFKYDNLGNSLGESAVYWGLDNVAIELNSLIHPDSGWLNLSQARGISNTGWVTGVGTYDPDGPGGDDPYERMFLLNISNIVPEPASLALFACAVVGCALRRQ